MQELKLHVPFWAYTILYVTALVLLLTIPKFSGKGWLVLFLVLNLFTDALFYLPNVLSRNHLITDTSFSAYFDTWRVIYQLMTVIGVAALAMFVLALKCSNWGYRNLSGLLFSFQGRVGRRFFWPVSLILLGVNAMAWLIWMGLTTKDTTGQNSKAAVPVVVVCLGAWYLVGAWIGLATQVKRWHDRDRSGWWVLIGLVPIIGGIWALIETGFLEGTVGENQFGPAPGQPASDPVPPGYAPGQIFPL